MCDRRQSTSLELSAFSIQSFVRAVTRQFSDFPAEKSAIMAAATLDQAAVDKRAREIETEYLSSLADLNVNSKPLINMLTILAEENLDYAPIIVNAVEKHLSQVYTSYPLK